MHILVDGLLAAFWAVEDEDRERFESYLRQLQHWCDCQINDTLNVADLQSLLNETDRDKLIALLTHKIALIAEMGGRRGMYAREEREGIHTRTHNIANPSLVWRTELFCDIEFCPDFIRRDIVNHMVQRIRELLRDGREGDTE